MSAPIGSDPDDVPRAPRVSAEQFLVYAFVVEVGLGIVALLISRLIGHDPLVGFSIGKSLSECVHDGGYATIVGVVATLPLLVLFVAIDRVPSSSIDEIRLVIEQQLIPPLRCATSIEIALLACAAGIGEELMFRGLIQHFVSTYVGGTTGLVVGIGISAVVFGLCHSVTTTYAVLAGLIGLYLGWLMAFSENIVAPAMCHGLYDLVVLVTLLRRDRLSQEKKRPGTEYRAAELSPELLFTSLGN